MKRHRSRASGPAAAHLCSRHHSPLSTFCCTDQQIICASCAITEHTGHTIGLVREERRRKQDYLMRLKKRCQQLLQQQDWTNALVQEKARETEDLCEAVLTRVIDLLQTHYMSLREQVQALKRAALSEAQAQAVGVKRRCRQLDLLASTDNDVRFLLDWPSVCRCCEEELREFTTELHQPFESLQNTVDSLGNQLEEFCNRQFTTITENAPGIDHLAFRTRNEDVQQTDIDSQDQQQSNELVVDDHIQLLDDLSDADEVTGTVSENLRTRADFLQYACNLTLDPRSAHEDLLISSDLKEVRRLAPKSGRGPAVHCPERFHPRRQLLCKEGLQADRCYYEVEITGGKTEIALAYKTIERKRLKQSAFGGNGHSWSLDCTSSNYSVSHKGESVQLTSVPLHKRIGVFLSFREGKVSFNEVSDTMRFLYTMEDEFREQLYPGFWIGDNCRLKICDLTKRLVRKKVSRPLIQGTKL